MVLTPNLWIVNQHSGPDPGIQCISTRLRVRCTLHVIASSLHVARDCEFIACWVAWCNIVLGGVNGNEEEE